MKPSALDHILKRPAMYAGINFASIDDFTFFFHGVSLGLTAPDGSIPDVDAVAISSFGAFMRYYLHGEYKNCHWAYDLLSQVGSQNAAVLQASALLRAFRDRLQREGLERLNDVIENAGKVRVIVDRDGNYTEHVVEESA